MYTIKVEQSFDSAHFLSNYNGKCANIHGHRWKVEVFVKTNELSKYGNDAGMVIDFTDLKKEIKEILNYYDHALIIEDGSMREKTLKSLKEDNFKIITVNFRTTAENFSYYFYNQIKEKGFNVCRVTVYETPTNSATYEE